MKRISRFFLIGLMVFASHIASAQYLQQKQGDARSAAQFQRDCASGRALDSCAIVPTPKGCPAGSHWVTIGSGIAHCVPDDPPCAGVVTHDSLGNPTGCSPVVVGTSYEDSIQACSAGYSGSQNYRRTVTHWSNGTTTYGEWTYQGGSCVAAPPPVCANGATNYPTCTFAEPPGLAIIAGNDGYGGAGYHESQYGSVINPKYYYDTPLLEFLEANNRLYFIYPYGKITCETFKSVTVNGKTFQILPGDCTVQYGSTGTYIGNIIYVGIYGAKPALKAGVKYPIVFQ